MAENILKAQPQDKKYIKPSEFVIYLMAVFFYTNMTGMVGSYRSAYLVNVLRLDNSQVTLFNTFVGVIPFILNFFITMYIDGRRPDRSGKFRPLILSVAVPCGILLVLSFWTPKVIESNNTMLLIYVTTIAVLWSVVTNFGDSINKVAFVLTPNLKERDTVISFRSICSAVGNSAPLVIILVIGLIWKNEKTQYIIGAALCAAVGTVLMLIGTKAIKERIAYNTEKKDPLVGIKDVLINKYAWVILISEFLKNFRQIATYMGVFMAAALLGSTSQYLWFGLPTGIGTALGMLLINFLLKKFNSKTLYICSGIYSLVINILAFIVGYIYFNNPSSALQILFIVFLFLVGLQFGASNLLPSMFQADVLEDIEAKTGKRLDATLPFVINIFTMISGTIASALAPKILYGDNSIIGYIQPTELDPEPEQSLRTKIVMLFFYTVFHGIMMFLAGVPFFFYKLTGKTKEDVHNAVLERRKNIENSDGEKQE